MNNPFKVFWIKLKRVDIIRVKHFISNYDVSVDKATIIRPNKIISINEQINIFINFSQFGTNYKTYILQRMYVKNWKLNSKIQKSSK
jgi:hypothetical protein